VKNADQNSNEILSAKWRCDDHLISTKRKLHSGGFITQQRSKWTRGSSRFAEKDVCPNQIGDVFLTS